MIKETHNNSSFWKYFRIDKVLDKMIYRDIIGPTQIYIYLYISTFKIFKIMSPNPLYLSWCALIVKLHSISIYVYINHKWRLRNFFCLHVKQLLAERYILCVHALECIDFFFLNFRKLSVIKWIIIIVFEFGHLVQWNTFKFMVFM